MEQERLAEEEGDTSDERVNFRVLLFIFEAKPRPGIRQTLLTRELFREMSKFEDFLYSLGLYEDHTSRATIDYDYCNATAAVGHRVTVAID